MSIYVITSHNYVMFMPLGCFFFCRHLPRQNVSSAIVLRGKSQKKNGKSPRKTMMKFIHWIAKWGPVYDS